MGLAPPPFQPLVSMADPASPLVPSFCATQAMVTGRVAALRNMCSAAAEIKCPLNTVYVAARLFDRYIERNTRTRDNANTLKNAAGGALLLASKLNEVFPLEAHDISRPAHIKQDALVAAEREVATLLNFDLYQPSTIAVLRKQAAPQHRESAQYFYIMAIVLYGELLNRLGRPSVSLLEAGAAALTLAGAGLPQTEVSKALSQAIADRPNVELRKDMKEMAHRNTKRIH